MKKGSYKYIGAIVAILAFGVGVTHIYVSVAKQKQTEVKAYLETPYSSLTELSLMNKVSLISATAEGQILTLALADTSYKSARGLALVDSIDQNQGMLYAYKQNGILSHSTVGMKFNLDIVWLNDSKKIIHIEKNLEPELKEVKPEDEAHYVIELLAGTVDRLNLDIGESVEFTI